MVRWWEAGLPGYDEEVPNFGHLPEPEEPSIMRQLLAGALPPDEVERLEITPGRWYLPGTPP